ncbi:MAG: hypothetical protein WCT49_05150 [Candidatus Paceibacterota bacterium]|jgi:hypothetical protein|nr:hypothetical protein [Candidatus Paceibacterota bacterium]
MNNIEKENETTNLLPKTIEELLKDRDHLKEYLEGSGISYIAIGLVKTEIVGLGVLTQNNAAKIPKEWAGLPVTTLINQISLKQLNKRIKRIFGGTEVIGSEIEQIKKPKIIFLS